MSSPRFCFDLGLHDLHEGVVGHEGVEEVEPKSAELDAVVVERGKMVSLDEDDQPPAAVDEWRRAFYADLDAYRARLTSNFRDSTLTRASYADAVTAVQTAKGVRVPGISFKFKHWAKSRFKLAEVALGETANASSPGTQPPRTRLELRGIVDDLPVVTYEDMFECVRHCHLRVKHQGIKKTIAEANKNYSNLPNKAIEICINRCKICHKRRLIEKSTCRTKHKMPVGFLARVQVDIVDMRARSDGDYKWILHLRDQVTRYNWAFPLENKCDAAEMAEHISLTFTMFGAAAILQTSNGEKFAAQLCAELHDQWPSVSVIHRRPRDKRSLKGNGDLEAALQAWLLRSRTKKWSSGLGHCAYHMNTSTALIRDQHDEDGGGGGGVDIDGPSETPYELVFRHKPRTTHFLSRPPVPDRLRIICSEPGSLLHSEVPSEEPEPAAPSRHQHHHHHHHHHHPMLPFHDQSSSSSSHLDGNHLSTGTSGAALTVDEEGKGDSVLRPPTPHLYWNANDEPLSKVPHMDYLIGGAQVDPGFNSKGIPFLWET